MAESRIGEPGWHFSLTNSCGNFVCARSYVVIRDQGHGRNFSGAMTALAMLLKNRENVAIENRRCAVGGLSREFLHAGLRSGEDRQNNNRGEG